MAGIGHGNSVPRFHITWGHGPGVLAPFLRRARRPKPPARLTFRFRHRVDGLIVTEGRSMDPGCGARAHRLERGVKSSRTAIGEFELWRRPSSSPPAAIGGDHRAGPQELAAAARLASQFMVQGVPDLVDGRMLAITEAAGARLINRDRMWHYTEGLRNWNPIWTNHGIRILPGPSSLWLDATGNAAAAALPGLRYSGNPRAHLENRI